MESDLRDEIGSPYLAHARALIALGDDDAAERAYLEALRQEGESFEALNDIGVLAHRRGRRTAARLAHERSLRLQANSPIAHVNLGNLLLEEGAEAAASMHYRRALAADPGFAPAHRGLARAYDAEGDARAAAHWRLADEGGYRRRPARGVGPVIPILIVASLRLGNMPVEPWLDDRLFDAHVVEPEHYPEGRPLPPHALLLNLIADADLCADALRRAQQLVARSKAPVINLPQRVADTGRMASARRLGALADVETPVMRLVTRDDLRNRAPLAFPFLLRAPGFHAGRHFLRVDQQSCLPGVLDALPGDRLLAMSVLDARGPDGAFRKYRAMAIDGKWLPLHLAISDHWKVHYFSAEMRASAQRRQEERRFLEDLPGALGRRGTEALQAIVETVGLDCFGIDFALAPDGSLRVFEANAAMAMLDPPAEPIWDYRRGPLAEARAAARGMILRRVLAAAERARRPHGARQRS